MGRVDVDSVLDAVCGQNLVPFVERLGFGPAVRAGSEWKILCPFHDDHKPSLTINASKKRWGLFKCFSCVAPDSMILTDRGLLRARQVEVGMKVAGRTGWTPVLAVTRTDESDNPVVKVRTRADPNGLTATPDHRMFWMSSPGAHEWSRQIYECWAGDLPSEAWIPCAIPRQLVYDGTMRLCSPKTQPIEVDVFDTELAWALGLYAAEGSICQGRAVHFSIHKNEIEQFAPRLEGVANLFGSKVTTFEKAANGAQLIISSVLFANLCRRMVGAGCEYKFCHPTILFGPVRSAASWLTGLYDGDGVFDGEGCSDHGIRLTSENLIRSAYVIATRCHAFPTMRKEQQSRGRRRVYSVGFRHRSFDKVRNVAAGSDPTGEEVRESVAVTQLAGGCWVYASRLLEVRSTGRRQPVIDLTTGDGSFATSTMLVHNCGWGPGSIVDFVGECYRVEDDFIERVRKIAELSGQKIPEKPAGVEQKRESRSQVQIEAMTPREVAAAFGALKKQAVDPAPYAEKLGVDVRAFALADAIVVPYGESGRMVLAIPMRRHDMVMTSVRFRCFATRRRWSLAEKTEIDGEMVVTKRTTAGLMMSTAVTALEFYHTLIIEGETDLLGGMTILLRKFGKDIVEWPMQFVGLPGAGACHDLVCKLSLGMTTTFFDADPAGERASFDSRRRAAVREKDGTIRKDESGRQVQRIDLETDRLEGLLHKLQAARVNARASRPPKVKGKKVDLREMARAQWTYDQLEEHLIKTSTRDPFGVRFRRES